MCARDRINVFYRSALVPVVSFGDTELIDVKRNGPKHLENFIPLVQTAYPEGVLMASLRLKRFPLNTIGMWVYLLNITFNEA